MGLLDDQKILRGGVAKLQEDSLGLRIWFLGHIETCLIRGSGWAGVRNQCVSVYTIATHPLRSDPGRLSLYGWKQRIVGWMVDGGSLLWVKVLSVYHSRFGIVMMELVDWAFWG